MPRKYSTAIRTSAFAAFLVAAYFALDWNENRSPWGIELQKARVIAIKRTYCNE